MVHFLKMKNEVFVVEWRECNLVYMIHANALLKLYKPICWTIFFESHELNFISLCVELSFLSLMN